MRKAIFILLSLCALIIINSSFQKEKHCVYRALMNEDPLPTSPVNINEESVQHSVEQGLKWLQNAQQENGGWGCGYHAYQKKTDPHQVPVDPATTAMAAMSILRSGSDLESGPYHETLKRATDYLMLTMENSSPNAPNITDLTGTQIQRKLGANIDLVLTTQYLTNLLDYVDEQDPMHQKIKDLLALGVDKIQIAQNENGSLNGGSWAGVLQSSYANSALESAQAKGVNVDDVKLASSRKYQKANYDLETEEVNTAAGAGIMLYAISSTARASAAEASKAKLNVQKAFKKGLIKDEEITVSNLVKSGISETEAMELTTSYEVYNVAKRKSQEADVMNGFGNNGGEEFLSFLQTGESLAVSDDDSWENWYDNITQKMMDIQNNDGSWNGHHCITSPVFCTATSVSILTIKNDIERLKNVGLVGE